MRNGSHGPRLPGGHEADPHPLEAVALWFLGALIALGGVVWATGQLSARLFRGTRPHVAVSEMGRVLLALPRHVRDPAKAWPQHARLLIPGPAAFYGTFAAIVLLVAALGWMVAVRIRQRHTATDSAP